MDQLDRFVAKLEQLTTEIDRSRFDLEALDREEFDEQKIESCRVDYNEYRPHQSLKGKTPMEFVTEHQ